MNQLPVEMPILRVKDLLPVIMNLQVKYSYHYYFNLYSSVINDIYISKNKCLLFSNLI